MEKNKIIVQNLNLHYGTNHALKNVNMEIKDYAITAFIGPSGCGKSTFLKCLNRMNDLVDGVKIEGTILLDGENILSYTNTDYNGSTVSDHTDDAYLKSMYDFLLTCCTPKTYRFIMLTTLVFRRIFSNLS